MFHIVEPMGKIKNVIFCHIRQVAALGAKSALFQV